MNELETTKSSIIFGILFEQGDQRPPHAASRHLTPYKAFCNRTVTLPFETLSEILKASLLRICIHSTSMRFA